MNGVWTSYGTFNNTGSATVEMDMFINYPDGTFDNTGTFTSENASIIRNKALLFLRND